ncbi:MAG: 50S ribosomal protein L21 [Actinomycetota bacterium]|nr:50S ribosomal protein L21 [Actinomycetota bacterium]MDA8208513.1 50S ribosomal protein L21 [Actinomycetota bacterium]
MYAVIKSGGKQEKVSVGASVRLELLEGLVGDPVDLQPIMVVDEENVVVGTELGSAAVKGEIVGFEKGPKVRGFKYRAKTNMRRRWGHRQKYAVVKVLEITK